ncbi:MAG TPA: amino acid permease [Steroidobacteraceae bacterium]|nr:amino acid permease [Steroidobacteraceae bacterium]
MRDPDVLLERALGVRELAATIFNYTVGSGIFALPAVAVARLGGAAPLAYFACAIVMGCVALCFAEAGSRVSHTGGPYAYVEVALGPLAGFVAGVLLTVTGLTAGAGVAVLFAQSLASLAAAGPRRTAITAALIVLVIGALALLNVRGVRRGARAVEIVTIAKLLPLAAFVAVGAFFVRRANLAWGAPPHLASVLGTAGVVIFAFSGIESALTPSGEVRAPARTVPRASFLALGAATLLYLAIQWVALGVLGGALAGTGATPLAAAAQVFAGEAGRAVLIGGATVSMLGYLSGNMLAVPRSVFALARDGFLPRTLAEVHARFRTPHVAVAIYAALLAALALSGTFEELAVLANLTAFVLYILCAIAVWRLRRLDVRSDGKPFVIPGGPLVPIATCVLNAGLIVETGSVRELIGLGVLCGGAVLLYGMRELRRARTSAP